MGATTSSTGNSTGNLGTGKIVVKRHRRLFNGFFAVLGLGLAILGFYGQMTIRAVCGSTPLRNSILGLILLGVSLAFIAGTMFFTDKSIMNTQVFVIMLFLIGATTLGLAGVIMKNSALKCENDFLCKKTIGDQKGQSKAGTEPCQNSKIVADIALAIGSLLIIAGGVYVYAVVDDDRRSKSGSTSSGIGDSAGGGLIRSRAATFAPPPPRKNCSS